MRVGASHGLVCRESCVIAPPIVGPCLQGAPRKLRVSCTRGTGLSSWRRVNDVSVAVVMGPQPRPHQGNHMCRTISLEGEVRPWGQTCGEPAGHWDIGTVELGGWRSRARRGFGPGGDDGHGLAWMASAFLQD